MSESSPALLRSGAIFCKRYRVVRCIKSGGMGAVYEVVDERTSTARALKVMLPGVIENPEMRARFALEARVTGAIESDHIVGTLDAGIDEESGTPFLIMELLRGEDLAALIAEGGPLSPEDVVTYLFQVALALEKTHAADIIHRDLKPENLFLTRRDDGSPRIKILDFGIAKIVAQSTHGAGTKAIGTPLYMAPEQMQLRRRLSPRTDLYALGHVAFTLLVGAAYWSDELQAAPSLIAFLTEVSRGVREPASARAARHDVVLPALFDSWFLKATAVSPEERFDSPLAQISTLAEALGIPLPGSIPPGFLDRRDPRSGDVTQPSTAGADFATTEPLAAGGSRSASIPREVTGFGSTAPAKPTQPATASLRSPTPATNADSNEPARAPARGLTGREKTPALAASDPQKSPSSTTQPVLTEPSSPRQRTAVGVALLAAVGALVAFAFYSKSPPSEPDPTDVAAGHQPAPGAPSASPAASLADPGSERAVPTAINPADVTEEAGAPGSTAPSMPALSAHTAPSASASKVRAGTTSPRAPQIAEKPASTASPSVGTIPTTKPPAAPPSGVSYDERN